MRLAFLGTPDFACPSLRALFEAGHEIALVVTQPDRPRGRGQKLQPSAVRSVARELGLPECVWERKQRDAMAERLTALGLDAIVVVAFGHILREPILQAATHGCLNVHASLLPRWRGPAPIHRAIVAGDETTGVSIMRLDPGVDTGPVFRMRECPIGGEDRTVDLHDRLSQLGASALCKTLSQIESQGLQPSTQSSEGISHAALLRKSEGSARFDRSAEAVHDRVRGLQPWPGVTVLHEGTPLRLMRTRIGGTEGDESAPGSVLEVGTESLRVACAGGSVELLELKPAGKGPMRAVDYARGHDLRVGSVLSPLPDFEETPVRP